MKSVRLLLCPTLFCVPSQGFNLYFFLLCPAMLHTYFDVCSLTRGGREGEGGDGWRGGGGGGWMDEVRKILLKSSCQNWCGGGGGRK